MTRTDIEDRVRKINWPGPSASLRARVVTEDSVAVRRTTWPARVASDGEIERQRPTPVAAAGPHLMPGWRRAGVLAALGIVVILGACSGMDLWAGREVEREIARLEARYGSLDEATLIVPAVPDSDNRAVIVRAAGAITVSPTPKTSYRGVDLPVSSPVPADLRAFAEANRSAILLAEGVRTRAQSNWEMDYRYPGKWISWEEWKGLDTLIDAIYVTTIIDMEAGRADDASHAIASGLAVSTSLANEPDRRFQSIRTGAASRLFRAVRRLITELEPSRTSLDDLARWMAEARSPDAMLVGLLGELKQTNAILARLENGEVSQNLATYIYPMTWPRWGAAYVGPIARMSRPLVRTARVRYLRYMGRLLDAQAGPRPRPAVATTVPVPQRWELIDRLTFKFAESVGMVFETGDDYTSEQAAAEVAVALRRYRLDRGGYPDDLAALVPTFLVSLPIDPSTGRPPAYARQGAGFTLRASVSRLGAGKELALEWNVPK